MSEAGGGLVAFPAMHVMPCVQSCKSEVSFGGQPCYSPVEE